jgi:hypothetical protein
MAKKAPTVKAKPKHDKDQRRRFIEAARAVGADETGERFERVFRHAVPPRRPPDQAKHLKKS